MKRIKSMIYSAPDIELFDVGVERGFTTSPQVGMDGMEYEQW